MTAPTAPTISSKIVSRIEKQFGEIREAYFSKIVCKSPPPTEPYLDEADMDEFLAEPSKVFCEGEIGTQPSEPSSSTEFHDMLGQPQQHDVASLSDAAKPPVKKRMISGKTTCRDEQQDR